MKSLLAAVALSLFSFSALAADTLTITIVSDGTFAGTLTKTFTFSQADMNAFQSFLLANYQCVAIPPATCTTTIQSAALAWATMLKGGIVSSVQSWATNTAVTSAAAGVTPINPN